MVRAPCCEKMGLKKGPWNPEEDQMLISYIQKHGNNNWRTLPKKAGLLRCGKSCRLRWINYLRPDIKRGNFTNEEEETIIKLHEMLGNRWSAIAAKLPGRTDNEIKNVWHTHLKKRLLKTNQTDSEAKSFSKPKIKRSDSNARTVTLAEHATSLNFPKMETTSACTSSSYLSSVTFCDEGKTTDNTIKSEDMKFLETMPEIGESYWSEARILDNKRPTIPSNSWTISNEMPHQYPSNSVETFQQSCGYTSNFEDEMDFWVDLFIRSRESIELPDL